MTASLDAVPGARPKIWNIADERLVFGSGAEMFGEDLTADPAWPAFAATWDALERDTYMNDGGTYRYRRFGRFKYYADGDRLEQQPHGPYKQPTYLNPLNGGIDRYFAPVTAEIAANPVFRRILHTLGSTYGTVEDVPMWKINTYFNRTLATDAEAGKPVPEGMHRDGVKFSCLFMTQYSGITGGVTTLFDNDKLPVFTGTLVNPGDCLIFRDDMVFHDTTAVTPTRPGVGGYRDVLVIEFR